MPNSEWYSVRSIFRSDPIEDGKARRVFEERIVLFRAASFEEAIAKGEAEAKRYAESCPHAKMLDYLVACAIHDEALQEGDEVWSCLRDLNISDEEYLRRIYEGEDYKSVQS